MFENGELDLMTIDSATYEAALDPSHPFNPLLKSHAVRRPVVHQEQDRHGPAVRTLQVRRALAHGADMRSIVKAVWGPTETFATGLISPLIPCHNPDALGHIYDPDLARQELATSSYGSADKLPPLLIDLARPLMVEMGLAVKEYWKDNLGIDLDILKRESGTPRREASQFYRISLGSWIPDPIQIVSNLTRRNPWGSYSWGYRWPLDALIEHARSLPLDDPERCATFQGGGRGIHGQGLHVADALGRRREVARAAVGGRLREHEQPRHQHDALDVRPAALGRARREAARRDVSYQAFRCVETHLAPGLTGTRMGRWLMEQLLAVTAHRDSFRRRSGRLVRLFLVATALSLTAACSQSPAPAPTPVVQVTVQPTVRFNRHSRTDAGGAAGVPSGSDDGRAGRDATAGPAGDQGPERSRRSGSLA